MGFAPKVVDAKPIGVLNGSIIESMWGALEGIMSTKGIDVVELDE